MTQAQFNREFKENIPNWEVMTLTDRRQYYNDMMEQYRRGGLITEKQAYNWGHPKFLTGSKNKINCSAY